ncbi:MAG: hypothetical protein KAT68_17325 [Bacteroidales bacterium]|nr:hypothetical protein [Bacteroidales bacterium]
MEIGKHIVSEGIKYRELIEISKQGKKKSSRTFHQTRINDKWINNRDFKKKQ